MVAVLGYLRGETKRVSLQVRMTNSAGIALYRQFSFREQGRIPEDTTQTARTLS